jgi:hypothetical protein
MQLWVLCAQIFYETDQELNGRTFSPKFTKGPLFSTQELHLPSAGHVTNSWVSMSSEAQSDEMSFYFVWVI